MNTLQRLNEVLKIYPFQESRKIINLKTLDLRNLEKVDEIASAFDFRDPISHGKIKSHAQDVIDECKDHSANAVIFAKFSGANSDIIQQFIQYIRSSGIYVIEG